MMRQYSTPGEKMSIIPIIIIIILYEHDHNPSVKGIFLIFLTNIDRGEECML